MSTRGKLTPCNLKNPVYLRNKDIAICNDTTGFRWRPKEGQAFKCSEKSKLKRDGMHECDPLTGLYKVKKGFKKQPAGEGLKKPLNAYMLWMQANRAQYKTQHPNLKSQDLVVFMATEWNSIKNTEQVAQYQQQAKALSDQYKQAVTGFREGKSKRTRLTTVVAKEKPQLSAWQTYFGQAMKRKVHIEIADKAERVRAIAADYRKQHPEPPKRKSRPAPTLVPRSVTRSAPRSVPRSAPRSAPRSTLSTQKSELETELETEQETESEFGLEEPESQT